MPSNFAVVAARSLIRLAWTAASALTSETSRLTSSTASSPNSCMQLSTVISRPSLQAWRSSPVAGGADRFVRGISLKPLGAGVPEFDRAVRPPYEHRFVRQRQQFAIPFCAFGNCYGRGALALHLTLPTDPALHRASFLRPT